MKTRTHFTFRVDTWTPDGESIVEHVAGFIRLRSPPFALPVNAGLLESSGSLGLVFNGPQGHRIHHSALRSTEIGTSQHFFRSGISYSALFITQSVMNSRKLE